MGRWLDQFLMFWDYDIFYLPAHCLGAFCLFRLFLMFFGVYLMTSDRGRRTRQKIPGVDHVFLFLFSCYLCPYPWPDEATHDLYMDQRNWTIFISSSLHLSAKEEERKKEESSWLTESIDCTEYAGATIYLSVSIFCLWTGIFYPLSISLWSIIDVLRCECSGCFFRIRRILPSGVGGIIPSSAHNLQWSFVTNCHASGGAG